jgi:hypothetical protein
MKGIHNADELAAKAGVSRTTAAKLFRHAQKNNSGTVRHPLRLDVPTLKKIYGRGAGVDFRDYIKWRGRPQRSTTAPSILSSSLEKTARLVYQIEADVAAPLPPNLLDCGLDQEALRKLPHEKLVSAARSAFSKGQILGDNKGFHPVAALHHQKAEELFRAAGDTEWAFASLVRAANDWRHTNEQSPLHDVVIQMAAMLQDRDVVLPNCLRATYLKCLGNICHDAGLYNAQTRKLFEEASTTLSANRSEILETMSTSDVAAEIADTKRKLGHVVGVRHPTKGIKLLDAAIVESQSLGRAQAVASAISARVGLLHQLNRVAEAAECFFLHEARLSHQRAWTRAVTLSQKAWMVLYTSSLEAAEPYALESNQCMSDHQMCPPLDRDGKVWPLLTPHLMLRSGHPSVMKIAKRSPLHITSIELDRLIGAGLKGT